MAAVRSQVDILNDLLHQLDSGNFSAGLTAAAMAENDENQTQTVIDCYQKIIAGALQTGSDAILLDALKQMLPFANKKLDTNQEEQLRRIIQSCAEKFKDRAFLEAHFGVVKILRTQIREKLSREKQMHLIGTFLDEFEALDKELLIIRIAEDAMKFMTTTNPHMPNYSYYSYEPLGKLFREHKDEEHWHSILCRKMGESITYCIRIFSEDDVHRHFIPDLLSWLHRSESHQGLKKIKEILILQIFNLLKKRNTFDLKCPYLIRLLDLLVHQAKSENPIAEIQQYASGFLTSTLELIQQKLLENRINSLDKNSKLQCYQSMCYLLLTLGACTKNPVLMRTISKVRSNISYETNKLFGLIPKKYLMPLYAGGAYSNGYSRSVNEAWDEFQSLNAVYDLFCHYTTGFNITTKVRRPLYLAAKILLLAKDKEAHKLYNLTQDELARIIQQAQQFIEKYAGDKTHKYNALALCYQNLINTTSQVPEHLELFLQDYAESLKDQQLKGHILTGMEEAIQTDKKWMQTRKFYLDNLRRHYAEARQKALQSTADGNGKLTSAHLENKLPTDAAAAGIAAPVNNLQLATPTNTATTPPVAVQATASAPTADVKPRASIKSLYPIISPDPVASITPAAMPAVESKVSAAAVTATETKSAALVTPAQNPAPAATMTESKATLVAPQAPESNYSSYAATYTNLEIKDHDQTVAITDMIRGPKPSAPELSEDEFTDRAFFASINKEGVREDLNKHAKEAKERPQTHPSVNPEWFQLAITFFKAVDSQQVARLPVPTEATLTQQPAHPATQPAARPANPTPATASAGPGPATRMITPKKKPVEAPATARKAIVL